MPLGDMIIDPSGWIPSFVDAALEAVSTIAISSRAGAFHARFFASTCVGPCFIYLSNIVRTVGWSFETVTI
jgi:hypothetical protein